MDQLPLSVVPDGACRLGPAAWLVEASAGGQVFIGGQLSFVWDAGDRAGRRLAAAVLVRVGAASQEAVAGAFGVATTTVYRWRRELDDRGAAGLVTERMGPRGPSKITDAVAADIRSRRAAGEQVASIAAATGVSKRSVATVLAAARGAAVGGRSADPAGGEDGAGGDDEESAPVAGGSGLWDGPAAEDARSADRTGGDSACPVAGPGDVASPGAGDGERVLPVLPEPARRNVERGLARAGLLGEAAPVFAPAGRVPLAGLLLAIPALVATGLLDVARGVYGALPAGFYGLSTMLIEAVFRALVGESRAEGTGRIDPAALGRVLGMDRAPEVTTIRRKIRQLADRGNAAALIEALAARQLAAVDADDTAAVLYVDGHTRVYHGRRKIQKTHVSRLRFPAPATEETWLCDAAGAPVWMVMAEPGSSLASEIGRLLPDIRRIVGDDRRVLVGFDRGGFSPTLFKTMTESGFDIITWRKGPAVDIDTGLFTTRAHADQTGRTHTYVLADTTVSILLDETHPGKGRVVLRQISKLDDTGRQVHVLTSRTDLDAAHIMWMMAARWREENFFRYSRIRFDLDAHDTYRAEDDDGGRMVPNPAKKTAYAAVQAARARLTAAQIEADRTFLELKSPKPGQVSTITNQLHNQVNQPVLNAAARLDQAKAAHRATPARLPLSKVRPGQQILETETKLITHTIRAAAFNTMATLAATVRTATDYARADHEAHNLIRTALKTTGDIDPRPETGLLHVRLDPLPTPRATAAITQLCDALNAEQAVFPDTDLKLHYTVSR